MNRSNLLDHMFSVDTTWRLLGSQISLDQSPFNLWDMIRIQIQLQRTKLNGSDVCTDHVDIISVYEYCLIPAAIMLIVACCTMTRKRFLTDFLGGRPGLAHPMNILEDRNYRCSYALAFGIAAQFCQNLLFGDSDLYKKYVTSKPEGQFKFLHVLYRISEVCLYCILMYPVFITITKRNIPFFGMGTLYMWALTLATILRLAWIDCKMLTVESHIIIVVKYLPSIFCMIGLSIVFPYRLVQLILVQNASMRVSHQEFVYQVDYVKDLISGKQSDGNRTSHSSKSPIERLKSALHTVRYSRRKGFRYSSMIICTYTAMAIVVYMVFYGITNEVLYWLKLLNDIVLVLEGIAKAIQVEVMVAQLAQAKVYIQVFYVCFIISMCVVILLSVGNLILMVINYRSNILKIYQGNYTGFPTRKEQTTQPTFLILSNIRYGGYQIAFAGIGIVIQMVLVMVALLLISTVLFDPVEKTLRPWFVEFLEYYWPLLIISGTVLIGQFLLVKFIFNPPESSNGKIAVMNRNLYFNWSYFMFYFNVFWGFLTVALRLLKSMIFTVCFFSRLDWCHFPKRFEILDEGYFAYVGLLYVENAHSNPVMRCFLSVVLEAVHGRERFGSSPFAKIRRRNNENSIPAVGDTLQLQSVSVYVQGPQQLRTASGGADETELQEVSGTSAESVLSERPQRKILTGRKRARTRWFLALTLSNNPALRQNRCHYMEQAKAAWQRKSAQSVLTATSLESR